jgi:hypothetical protein
MWSAKRLQAFLDMMLFCSVVPDLVEESNGCIFKGQATQKAFLLDRLTLEDKGTKVLSNAGNHYIKI